MKNVWENNWNRNNNNYRTEFCFSSFYNKKKNDRSKSWYWQWSAATKDRTKTANVDNASKIQLKMVINIRDCCYNFLLCFIADRIESNVRLFYVPVSLLWALSPITIKRKRFKNVNLKISGLCRFSFSIFSPDSNAHIRNANDRMAVIWLRMHKKHTYSQRAKNSLHRESGARRTNKTNIIIYRSADKDQIHWMCAQKNK